MSPSDPLPLISESDCNPIPVFNCHVILGKPDDNGRLEGRCANLEGIRAEGSCERDVLTAIMKKFRASVQEFQQAKQDIPWRPSSESPGDGEVERFIPVHL